MTLRGLAIAAVAIFAALIATTGRSGPAAAETAIFAGGCFWCVEADFDKVRGVTSTTSGFAGGHLENPTYKQVSAGGTGHYEAVKIEFDPSVVSYEQLLELFWHSVDPTDAGGQFCDRGSSYRTAVFATSERQRALAEASKAEAARELGRKIVTPVEEAPTFYPAEGYHQDYYKKSPVRYKYYRFSCGRNASVRRLWGERAYAGIADKVS